MMQSLWENAKESLTAIYWVIRSIKCLSTGEPECILKYNLSFRKVRLLISILFFYKEKITVADAEYKIKHPNERS